MVIKMNWTTFIVALFILLFFIHFTFLYIDFILYGAVRLSIVSFMTPIIASVFYSDIPWHAIGINITDLYFFMIIIGIFVFAFFEFLTFRMLKVHNKSADTNIVAPALSNSPQ